MIIRTRKCSEGLAAEARLDTAQDDLALENRVVRKENSTFVVSALFVWWKSALVKAHHFSCNPGSYTGN
jgi:hypothetical protein